MSRINFFCFWGKFNIWVFDASHLIGLWHNPNLMLLGQVDPFIWTLRFECISFKNSNLHLHFHHGSLWKWTLDITVVYSSKVPVRLLGTRFKTRNCSSEPGPRDLTRTVYETPRPTPTGPVRWRYWPPNDQPGTQMFCNLKIAHVTQKKAWSQFLRPADDSNTVNSVWNLPVSANNKPVYITRLELVVCMENQQRSEYFSRSYWKFGQNNVAENDEAIFSICHDVIDDVTR
jgi:hypothetical protein